MPTTKVSVNLPLEDVEILKELAGRRHTSVTNVLRQAIASERLLDETVRKGDKVLIESDNRTRELIFKL